MKRLLLFMACTVALLCAVLPACAAESATEVTEVPLNSGANREADFLSVNETFATSAGPRNLILYGLREGQKEPVLSALEKYWDPEKPVLLKLTDDAFPDAEKYDSDELRDIDSGLCWASSVSNMLWISGWAKEIVNPRSGEPFASEDDLFDYYFSKFTNDGLEYINSGIDWFFTGSFYELTYSHAATLLEDDPGDGLRRDTVSALIQERIDLIRDPRRIESMLHCDWTGEEPSVFEGSIGSLLEGELLNSEHAVTVLGVITDPSADTVKTRFKAILIADSDDDAVPEDAGSEDRPEDAFLLAARKARPNALRVYPLRYAEDVNHTPYWQVVGYGSDPSAVWALFRLNRLRIYDPALPDLCRETEGTANVHTTVDLTLEKCFTTDSGEPLRDLYGVEEKDVIVTVFDAGAPVRLNYFVANRTALTLDEETRQGKELTVDWTVTREEDGSVVASGRSACDQDIWSRFEVGFLAALNEKDGKLESWAPGAYTVTLELNKDRGIPEAYYRNNEPKTVRFEIR